MDLNEDPQDVVVSPPSSKADEAALELMKQLITLASGVLALGAAFIDRLPKSSVYLLILLFGSWTALASSIFFGLKTISAIVKSRIDSDDEWSRGKGRQFARFSQGGFLLGISLFATFAFISLISAKKEEGITISISSDDARVIEFIKTLNGSPKQSAPQIAPASSPSPTK